MPSVPRVPTIQVSASTQDSIDLDAMRSWWEVYGPKMRLSPDVLREETSFLLNMILQAKLVDGTILEVGSGAGQTRHCLAQLGTTLVNHQSVDFVTSTRYRHREVTGVLPEYWDGYQLPFEDHAFDLVFATDTLHFIHPDQVGTFIAECKRVSKGTLIFSAATRGIRPGLRRYQYLHDYDALWKEAGLEVVVRRNLVSGSRSVWLLEVKQ